MPKSLLFAVSLVFVAPQVHDEARTDAPPAVQSGRSATETARDAWFQQAVGDILDGRVAGTGSAPQR